MGLNNNVWRKWRMKSFHNHFFIYLSKVLTTWGEIIIPVKLNLTGKSEVLSRACRWRLLPNKTILFGIKCVQSAAVLPLCVFLFTASRSLHHLWQNQPALTNTCWWVAAPDSFSSRQCLFKVAQDHPKHHARNVGNRWTGLVVCVHSFLV